MACLPRWVSIAIVLAACSGDGGAASPSSVDTSGSGPSLPAESTGAGDSTGPVGDDTSGSTAGGSGSSSSGAQTGSTSGDATTGDESESSGSDTGASQDWVPTCPPPGGGALGQCYIPPGGDECNPFLQDCDPGSKCGFNQGEGTAWFFLAGTCMPVVGQQTVGEPCSYTGGFYFGEDNCDDQSWCNNVDYATMIGECVELCICGDTCDTPGSFCQHSGYPAFCGYLCDPLLGDDACKEGWLCQPEIGSVTQWSAGMFTCKPNYAIPSEADPGPQPCPNGWVMHQVTGECVELCATNGEQPCPAGFACEAHDVLGTCIQDFGFCEPV
jgi:hypothetical protein